MRTTQPPQPTQPTQTAAVALAAALALSACAGTDDTDDQAAPDPTASASTTASPSPSTLPSATPSSEPSPTSSPTASPSPTTDEVAPLDAPPTTEPTSAPEAGDPIAVTGFEVTSHDGFDRVAFAIGGEGVAGWDVRYDVDPRAQGSGEPVDVEGSTALAVSITGAAFPPDAPAPVYDGPERRPVPTAEAVVEVVAGTVYEGTHTFYIGVDEPRPFRIGRLESPQRIVIDVVTD